MGTRICALWTVMRLFLLEVYLLLRLTFYKSTDNRQLEPEKSQDNLKLQEIEIWFFNVYAAGVHVWYRYVQLPSVCTYTYITFESYTLYTCIHNRKNLINGKLGGHVHIRVCTHIGDVYVNQR